MVTWGREWGEGVGSEMLQRKVGYSEAQIREQVGEAHQAALMAINRDNEDITSSAARQSEA